MTDPMTVALTAPSRESPTKRAALLGLKIAGGVSWTLAYREAIHGVRKTGHSALPATAIAFNLVWEAIYTTGGIIKWRELSLEDRVQTLINAVWLGYDLKLSSELREDLKSRRLAFAVAVIYQAVFLIRLPPSRAARAAAFWQNFGFSAYAALAPTSANEARNLRFTLLRAVGTATPTLTSGISRGIDSAYLIPGIGCLCFDLLKLGRDQAIVRRRPKEL